MRHFEKIRSGNDYATIPKRGIDLTIEELTKRSKQKVEEAKQSTAKAIFAELDKIVEVPDGFPKSENHKDGRDDYISERKYQALKSKYLKATP